MAFYQIKNIVYETGKIQWILDLIYCTNFARYFCVETLLFECMILLIFSCQYQMAVFQDWNSNILIRPSQFDYFMHINVSYQYKFVLHCSFQATDWGYFLLFYFVLHFYFAKWWFFTWNYIVYKTADISVLDLDHSAFVFSQVTVGVLKICSVAFICLFVCISFTFFTIYLFPPPPSFHFFSIFLAPCVDWHL